MKRTIKEYEVMSVEMHYEDTEAELNKYAAKGYRVVCSYAKGRWFVLERDKVAEGCDKCGKLK